MSMLRFRLQLLTSRARLCQNISWIQFAINFVHPQNTIVEVARGSRRACGLTPFKANLREPTQDM